jgi:acyl-CoA reductase-like NAD-dependent aldehyde dehydrogenase
MSQSLMMSGSAVSAAETPPSELDEQLATLRERADAFARVPPAEKARLLRECMPGVLGVAREWVAAACRAKGIEFGSPTSGEEWLAGPVTTMRNLRLFAEALESIARDGRPPLGRGVRNRSDGRLEVDVFPPSGHDKALFSGFSACVLMQEGVGEREAREQQAGFYQRRDPKGGVALILGAGNVASIPPMDTLYKMVADGRTCLLKMNPVNEYLGPLLERAFRPLVDRGWLRVCYGAADTGKYLCEHPTVDDIHITGSDRTHDLIVWGPPGPEQEKRKRAGERINQKAITSELGNVSPVAIVPADYTDEELSFQARSVASMVANNGSFNCNAAKMLIVGKGWRQRERFLSLVGEALQRKPPRNAYYPGALDRYRQLTEGREVRKIGPAGEGQLPWTLIPEVDAARADEPLFRVEPFCAILSETALDEREPDAFLAAATRFMNERLWGTLNAAIVIRRAHEKDPTVGRALDRALVELRYGTVAINHWPALGYGFVTTPWGGHPSATLADIQSGLGWVHNTFLLDGIDKAVIRGPLTYRPKPPWFVDHKTVHRLGEKMVAFEAAPSWLKVPGLAMLAFSG